MCGGTPASLRPADRIADTNDLALVRDTAEKWNILLLSVGLTVGKLRFLVHAASIIRSNLHFWPSVRDVTPRDQTRRTGRAGMSSVTARLSAGASDAGRRDV